MEKHFTVEDVLKEYPHFYAQPNDIGPNFRAEAYFNQEKKIKPIQLEEYRNKWVVLFFYPSNFTLVWMTEIAAVAALYHEFKRLDTEVLAISTDSVHAHKVFIEVTHSLKNVSFPLVSDRTQSISKAYRLLNEQTGASLRGTLIINPDGIIMARLINPSKVGRNLYEIIRLLEALRFSVSTGDMVPANWMPRQTGF